MQNINGLSKIQDQETIELTFNIIGQLSTFEQNDLKQFIHNNVIGKAGNYKALMQEFCNKNNYILDVKDFCITIIKN